MKPSLLFVMILILTYLKGDDHSFWATKQQNLSSYTDQYIHLTISGTGNKSVPISLLAVPVLCDDDDEFEFVKKRSSSSITFSTINSGFEKNQVHNELKRSSEYSNHSSQPVYIFQRELLI